MKWPDFSQPAVRPDATHWQEEPSAAAGEWFAQLMQEMPVLQLVEPLSKGDKSLTLNVLGDPGTTNMATGPADQAQLQKSNKRPNAKEHIWVPAKHKSLELKILADPEGRVATAEVSKQQLQLTDVKDVNCTTVDKDCQEGTGTHKGLTLNVLNGRSPSPATARQASAPLEPSLRDESSKRLVPEVPKRGTGSHKTLESMRLPRSGAPGRPDAVSEDTLGRDKQSLPLGESENVHWTTVDNANQRGTGSHKSLTSKILGNQEVSSTEVRLAGERQDGPHRAQSSKRLDPSRHVNTPVTYKSLELNVLYDNKQQVSSAGNAGMNIDPGKQQNVNGSAFGDHGRAIPDTDKPLTINVIADLPTMAAPPTLPNPNIQAVTRSVDTRVLADRIAATFHGLPESQKNEATITLSLPGDGPVREVRILRTESGLSIQLFAAEEAAHLREALPRLEQHLRERLGETARVALSDGAMTDEERGEGRSRGHRQVWEDADDLRD